MVNKIILIAIFLIFSLISKGQYTVSQIGFSPKPLTGTLVVSNDDAVHGPFNIGFDFCYWQNIYSQFYIGSNGWLGFTVPQSTSFTSQLIPSTNFLVPRNCIMGPWYDLNPGIAGFPATLIQYIYYRSYGVAPNRYLVVSWVNSPLYQCTTLRGTQQIVIYESTGVIENSIIKKVICYAWANGTATQGLHNINGTQAVTVPGRNSTQWTATDESWVYTPINCCTTTSLLLNKN
jgi:hypothetical protein